MTDTRAIIVVKKGELNKFKIVKDQYASPQNVFHISGKTSVDIIASLEKHAPQMIQLLRKQKKPKLISHINPTVISNKFHINLQVPSGYAYVLQKSNFMWLKRDYWGNTSL
jgi:hypothetical protein